MTPHVQDGERAAGRRTIERRASGVSRTSGSVRWRSLGLAVGLSLSCVLTAATSNADKPQTTATVLRRAELIRNPYAGIAVDIDLSVVSRESGRELRSSSYILITNRRDQSLIK